MFFLILFMCCVQKDIMTDFLNTIYPPEIIAHSPADNETDVPIRANIIVEFSTSMDTDSVENAFRIDPAITGIIEWNADRTKFAFIQDVDYERRTTYLYSINVNAKSEDGLMLESPFNCRFTTVE